MRTQFSVYKAVAQGSNTYAVQCNLPYIPVLLIYLLSITKEYENRFYISKRMEVAVTFNLIPIHHPALSQNTLLMLTNFYYFSRLPDSWVLESQAASLQTKVLPLSTLPSETVTNLDPSLYAPLRHRKQRRK